MSIGERPASVSGFNTSDVLHYGTWNAGRVEVVAMNAEGKSAVCRPRLQRVVSDPLYQWSRSQIGKSARTSVSRVPRR